MSNARTPITDLLRILSDRFREERCTQLAGSLTFTTLLALIPMLTVALTVVSAFPLFEPLLDYVQTFVINSLVPSSIDAIATYADQFSENAARLTTLGIVFLAITALLLMLTIDRAFNNIWRVSRPRPLVQRLILYCGLLTVGPVLIGASLSLTSYLITLSLGFIEETHAGKVLVLKVIALLLTSIAFAFMYLIVPNRRVRSRDALVAGLAAGLCFEAMKQGFGVFIAHFPTYKLVYGTFAVLPIFLLWIYVSWLIVVAGAVLTAVLPEWRERVLQNEPVPGSEFVSAIQALKLLCQAGHAGDPVSLSKLHGTVKERIDRLEEIMATLSTAGWTARAGRRGWVLARDATRIKVADIYRLFVFRADSAGFRDHASAEAAALVREIVSGMERNMQMSLGDLFNGANQVSDPHTAGRTAQMR
jgi:membrane protein